MTNNEIIAHFRGLVAKFKEMDRCFLKAIEDRDFENPVWKDIYELAHQIKEELGQFDVLQVDDLVLRNDLCAIREGKDFIYFIFLQLLQGNDDAGKPKEIKFEIDLSDEKFHEILSCEILPQVGPYDIVRRKMQIGALLVGKMIPEHLKNHLVHIKECYVWGFDSAAAIYCRTILEEGFRESLKSKPGFRTPQRRQELNESVLNWLLNAARQNRYYYEEVMEKAYTVKENVNHIVHPTSAKKPSNPLTNLEIIKDTFYILEMIFRY